ncbi:MAG: sodium-dependent transporter [Muribaculaceae bacterium]|nr:sodium-dependent transporter [Muribaculaceae bacterium]
MSTKSQFATKIGLIAATVGSAVGLGNVWRFPAETQTNGGAAFLLVYVICVLLLGIPVMLAEFSLGRGGGSDAVGVFRKLAPGKAWWIVGAVAVLASYLILCYYMVVAGWTLEYLWESAVGGLFEGVGRDVPDDVMRSSFAAKMDSYVGSDFRPLLFTFLMIAGNIGILVAGVQKGIEKLSNVLMPMLFIILVGMCCVSLSLPDAGEGVSYFLSPDFSKITPRVVINGLGQAFFSLSLGMGILITYSSYYPADTRLTRTSVIVALLSLLVAVLMGMTIFPAVKSFGLDKETLEGATLVFVTLPEVFARLPFPQLWSTLFFLLLLVAALTSTVSIAEVSIAMMQDRLGLSRVKATLAAMLPLFLLSAVCSLSFGSLSDFKVLGMTVFDLLDRFTTDILLPVVSIAVCVYMGWFAPKGLLHSELSNKGSLRSVWTAPVLFVIRYVAPLLIALILIFNYI